MGSSQQLPHSDAHGEPNEDLPELEELEVLDFAPFDYEMIHSNLKFNDLTKLQKLTNSTNNVISASNPGGTVAANGSNGANLVNHQLTANYYYNKNVPLAQQQQQPSGRSREYGTVPKAANSHNQQFASGLSLLLRSGSVPVVSRTRDFGNTNEQAPQRRQQENEQEQADHHNQENHVINHQDAHPASANEETFYDYRLLYRSQVYVPPLNFSVVENGIYRSGHPIPINFGFLTTLKLQTIIYLGDKEDQHEYYKWLCSQGIRFHYIKTESSSEPFVMNSPYAIITALQLVLDRRNFPMLIHSNKGKHRVGVLVGIMRKILQGWSLSGIFDEYVKFAAGKGEADLEFMELFNPQLTLDLNYKPDFVRLS